MRVLRLEAHRRIAILMAESSMRRKFIGGCARLMGVVPVARAMDMIKAGKGKIYLPDKNDPLLIRGVDTQFDVDIEKGSSLILPSIKGNAASTEIAEIVNAQEVRLKRPFSGDDALGQLTGGSSNAAEGDFQGTSFKTAPKVDQTEVYNAVFERLNQGGCVCIFPEGGSHDRTDLLPIKAGVALMALGSLAANPDSDLKIVPCGMNYFHAHKFRSRAVVEFGPPLDVPSDLVNLYKSGERREATRLLLDTIHQALVAVTVTSPDYDTLMLIQAARRLYNPTGKKLPLPMIVELNRRLVKGYTKYKDDPRIVQLKQHVLEYNKQLRLLGVRDHQVEYAKFSILKVVLTLIYRTGRLLLMSSGTIPGLILFSPVFIASKLISIKKSREALAKSTVKLQGRDVMATWKLLVAMAFAPALYATYTILFTYLTYRNRFWGRVPEWVPLWLAATTCLVFLISVTFAALRFGENGMDIFKSLRPLTLSLNPTSANTLHKLRVTREKLSLEVTEIINTLGPEMFEDFDHYRIVTDPFKEGFFEPKSPKTHSPLHARFPIEDSPLASPTGQMTNASIGGGSSAYGHLPRNESFKDLGQMSLFATRPPSRNQSRSGSEDGGRPGLNGRPLKRFSTVSSKESADEVSKRIRGAMQERGKERSRKLSEGSSWDMADSSPENEDEKKKI